MTSSNPFNFIDPLTQHIPVNKFCKPSEETLQTYETYFNGVTKKMKEPWQYDNYFSKHIIFDIKQKRGDRKNIDYYCAKIHEEEKKKVVPCCTQSWYGHRKNIFAEPNIYGRTFAYKSGYRPSGMSWPKQIREDASENQIEFRL